MPVLGEEFADRDVALRRGHALGRRTPSPTWLDDGVHFVVGIRLAVLSMRRVAVGARLGGDAQGLAGFLRRLGLSSRLLTLDCQPDNLRSNTAEPRCQFGM